MNDVLTESQKLARLRGCSFKLQPGEPTDYVPWHLWAERYTQTHACSECQVCHLFHVWTLKTREAR